jgi:tRNA(Ile)-lysidine synthase
MVLGTGDWVLKNVFSDSMHALLFSYEPAPSPQHPAPNIAIALSGGPDSMALTLLAQEWARAHGSRIVALTVDHALRPESRAEAEQVAAWMRARGIDHHILTPEHTPAGNNTMQAARQWRYDALAEWCHAHDIRYCLLGHHKGDQRETVLLNAARGGDGLSGMPRLRDYRGVKFLRPLLGLEKEELENYLRAHAMGWIEDPSNRNADFARVRIRQQLAADAALRKTTDARIVQEQTARRARDQALVEAASACVTIHPAGFASIAHGIWLQHSLQQLLIADTLRCISGAAHRVRSAEIARLVQAICEEENGKRSLQHCLITWDSQTITIAREPSRVASAATLSGSGELLWDKRFRVNYHLPRGMEFVLKALGKEGVRHLRKSTKNRASSFPEFAEANLGNDGIRTLPLATPSLWHLDELVMLPHIDIHATNLSPELRCTIDFAPAKPLAASAFW